MYAQMFLYPLEQAAAEKRWKWLQASDVAAMFGSLEIIYTANLEVLAQLVERYSLWPKTQKFGEIFLQLVCPVVQSCGLQLSLTCVRRQ